MKKSLPLTLRTPLFLGLLCLALQLARSQSNSSPAAASMQRDFQAAMTAEDSGDLDRAESLLSSLHSSYPGIFEIDESLGLLYAGRESYSLALPLLEAAARERSGSSVAHANLGAVLYKLHRNQEALRALNRAVHIDAHNVAAQQSLGQVLLEEHMPERAVAVFSAALRLKPSDDLAFSYAAALVACERYDEATRTLSLTATSGQSALAQSLLGEIDEKKGSFQSALHHFARAVELDPNEENAWSLGVELLRHWTFDAAIKEFEAGAAKFPQSTRMKLGLGAAYFGNANYPQAAPVFASLMRKDPDNEMNAHLLGLTCDTVADKPMPECSLLLDYARAHPRDSAAAIDAAALLITQSQQDEQLTEAGALLKNALAAEPNSPQAHFYLGLLLQNQSQWKESIAPLEEAIALKPNYAQAHYRLGLAYARTGRKQDGKIQIDLQRQYSAQQQTDLDQRLRQIARFVFDAPEKH